VIIIDEKLANRYWKNENPIGKRIAFSNSSGNLRWREIVGVVGHVKNAGLKEDGAEQLYLPHAQLPENVVSIVVHTGGDISSLPGLIRALVRSLNPELPIYQVTTMDNIISGSVSQPRFNMLLFVLFALLALSLAAVGIYGVLSNSVAQRRKEIGIRMALGAGPDRVRSMIVRQSLRIAGAGILAGIIASLLLSRFLQSMLFHIKPIDPFIYLGAAVFALLIAFLATSIPAKRASQLDPLRTLRE
jgi:ABC-type antimicrobial peptide transport system permease subunit